MRQMIRLAFAMMILTAMLAHTGRAQDGAPPVDPSKPPPDPAAQARLGEATAPSLVRVEYTLRFDKGEAPTSAGWTTRCPNCGQFHGTDVSSVVQEDRP